MARLLFVTHLYPPDKLSGSEIYLHELIKLLQARGHDCRVLRRQTRYWTARHYVYDGVEVFPEEGNGDMQFIRADFIFCHLDYTHRSLEMAQIYKRPIIHITHSPKVFEHINSLNWRIGVVYNSHSAAEQLNYKKPSSVFHPVIRKFPATDPNKRKYITQVNLNYIKGGDRFWDIARHMPDYHFLAVKGTYGEQIIDDLPNVIVMDPQTDMSKIYEKTRILIMPSREESFGITAGEAMAQGIPVICTDTPGLRENCGEAAIYCDPGNVMEWVMEIVAFDLKIYYLCQSNLCLSRAAQVNSETELLNLETLMRSI